MGHALFPCVGGMEHVALHQREKNFSCRQALSINVFAELKIAKKLKTGGFLCPLGQVLTSTLSVKGSNKEYTNQYQIVSS